MGKSSSKILESVRERKAWLLISGYVLLLGLPLSVGISSPLIFIFPLSSFALGLFLYFYTPSIYISFVWWLFFSSTLIRRLIDYHSGYITPGPWGFTAVLVASISLITAFQHLPTSHRKGGTPFVLVFAAIAYAFLAGVFRNPLNAVFNGTLAWISPVSFGFHIYMQWRDYPKIKQVFIKTFLWGVLFMGIYGIIQYVFAPPWEQFFLDNSGAGSFGKPEPFGIRVFSSLGAPQAFAAFMLTGLIIIFCEVKNPLSYLASGFGYISFILTMARAVWLSAAIGIPLFLLSLKPNHQIRVLMVMAIIFTIVATALFSWEPVYEKFYTRFESFFDIEGDSSLSARAAGYQALLGIALAQFLGQGLGFSFRSLGLDITLGSNDGSIFPLLFTFGWLGLVFYLGGFLMIFTKLLQLPDARSDIFIGACRMVVICVIAQSGFNSVFGDGIGLILWGFSAIGIAGHKYYLWQNQKCTELPENLNLFSLSSARSELSPNPHISKSKANKTYYF